MANETNTETTVESALEASLWQSIAAFVAKCGGDVKNASPADREQFGEEIQAWAVLALDDDGDSE
jgi:hypothetical protein